MKTKKDIVLAALQHVDDFDSVKQLHVFVQLHDWINFEYHASYKWKKYSKKEWCIRTINSLLRNNSADNTTSDSPHPNLEISNILSVTVQVEK